MAALFRKNDDEAVDGMMYPIIYIADKPNDFKIQTWTINPFHPKTQP